MRSPYTKFRDKPLTLEVWGQACWTLSHFASSLLITYFSYFNKELTRSRNILHLHFPKDNHRYRENFLILLCRLIQVYCMRNALPGYRGYIKAPEFNISFKVLTFSVTGRKVWPRYFLNFEVSYMDTYKIITPQKQCMPSLTWMLKICI